MRYTGQKIRVKDGPIFPNDTSLTGGAQDRRAWQSRSGRTKPSGERRRECPQPGAAPSPKVQALARHPVTPITRVSSLTAPTVLSLFVDFANAMFEPFSIFAIGGCHPIAHFVFSDHHQQP